VDVASWLRNLGLEHYEATFRENHVSPDVLRHLTAEDLKELGVAAVGHRRQLLVAIAGLQDEAAPVQAIASTDEHRTPTSAAERRPITVLFCDIVGSTPLSTHLDPEDLRALIGDYQLSVAAAVRDLRGTVVRFVGDGVLAYFGWPNADEAQAESAVRAGFAIIDAVRPQRLAVRIGIAMGLVVVGDLAGTLTAQKLTAVGETPNLAARLQGLAEPDTIVVSDATRAQIGGLFEVEELGVVDLKGFDVPQRVWRVRRETTLASHSEALFGRALAPLIGRDDELDWIMGRWRQANAGEGQVVLLAGEPGIGKSRLLAALETRLSVAPHTVLRYFCSPHHQESPFYPIITRWENEAGFARDDMPVDKFGKLAALLLSTRTSAEDIALIADLLGVPVRGHYVSLSLSPQRKRERTLDALILRLISRARNQPVLMIFEDAHWADPSTLALLHTVIGLLSDLPVLLVVSFRLDFTTPWVGQAGVTLITLNKLNRRQAAELVAQVPLRRALPAERVNDFDTAGFGI
jgi:class 3 adenylate cyclase